MVQPPNSGFCKIYFESLQANWVWRKLGENREKIVFVISRHKRKVPHWFIIQNYWNWFKNNAFLRFPATRMLVPKFHHFCRNLNWLCLLSHILCHKNINYAKFFKSHLQLQTYTAYRSLQKIAKLTRPYFLESCGWDVTLKLLCHQGSVTI